MVLRQSNRDWFGDNHVDLRELVSKYSVANGYVATRFRDIVCSCGHDAFRLRVDDDEGYAIVDCDACGSEMELFDSAEYREDANPEECGCPCRNDILNICSGEALYEGTEDSRWAYVGARCVACGMIGVYSDWKTP